MPERWMRDSWRRKPIVQVPDYPDKAALDGVTTYVCENFACQAPLVGAAAARAALG